MFKGIVGLLVVALVSIAALPEDVEAQNPARIRVSARVVSSLMPETHAAIGQQLSWLAQAGQDEVMAANQQHETVRGFARISTERLESACGSAPDRATDKTQTDNEGSQSTVRITVAYTAN